MTITYHCLSCRRRAAIDDGDCLHELPRGDEHCSHQWEEDGPEELSDDEKRELDRLYDESRRRQAEDGVVWPEFTGDGR